MAEGSKTLDDVKRSLRERLAARRAPLSLCDPAEAAVAIERLDGLDGDRWASAWAESAARFERAAEDAERQDDRQAAAEARFQAYSFYYLGRYPCPNHPRKEECAARARENYVLAGRRLDPPLERVAIPFVGRGDEGQEVVAYLRRPRGASRPPVVVVWGGTEGYKEERQDICDPLLAEGLATLALDMPGTGESPLRGSVDAERQYDPVFAWLRGRSDLDGSRVACLGTSFGGYWAAKLAHTHADFLRGAVNWGGGVHYSFQPDRIEPARYADGALMDLAEARIYMLGAESYEEHLDRIREFSLLDQGLLDRSSAPMLVVNGKDDRLAVAEDVYLLLEHGSPKSARLFPGGHMGRTPQTVPTIVRWVRERVTRV